MNELFKLIIIIGEEQFKEASINLGEGAHTAVRVMTLF